MHYPESPKVRMAGFIWMPNKSAVWISISPHSLVICQGTKGLFSGFFYHFIYRIVSFLSFYMACIVSFLLTLDKSILLYRSKQYGPFIDFRRSLLLYHHALWYFGPKKWRNFFPLLAHLLKYILKMKKKSFEWKIILKLELNVI